jgi:membrane fusion protein (multidrug efflux system)
MKKLVVALLSCSVVIAGCSSSQKKMQLPPHHVDVLQVQSYNVPYELDYPATVSGVADFPVVARVSGVLMKQLYTEGTYVKKGQPLYQIDPRPFQAQLEADQGQLIKDSTQVQEYKSILDRYTRLYKVGGVAKQDVETATINYKNAVGQVQTDQGNIANDKLNLQYCLVTAPVDGLIAERVVTVGQMISAYQTTLNYINSATALYVNFSVPEDDRLTLQEGVTSGKIVTPKSYKFDINVQLADGSMINNVGKVNFFDTRISLQNGTWNMRADVDNKKINDRLLSGQFVHVYLIGAMFKNAVAIPQAAVFRDDTSAFVYLLGPDNKIVKRNIVTGVMTGSLWVIDSGLNNGDKVIVNGGMKVMPGDKVVVDSLTDQSHTSNASAAI